MIGRSILARRIATFIPLSAAVLAMFHAPARAEFESPEPPPLVVPGDEGARPFDLSIRAFMGYNDNVQFVEEGNAFFDGDTESFYSGAQMDGVYRFVQNEQWTAGVPVSVGAVYPFASLDGTVGDDPNDYNFYAFNPGVFVTYHHQVKGRPAYATLRYDFRREDGLKSQTVAAIGLKSHRVGGEVGVEFADQWTASLAYAHGWDEFDVNFPATPTLNERDAQHDQVLATVRYSWDEDRRSVAVSYEFFNNDAEGRNFAYDAHGVRLRAESHLTGPLWGAFEFRYRHGDYDGFIGFPPPPGRNWQDLYSYRVQVVWVLDQHWQIDGFYERLDLESNSSFFEIETNNVGLGLTYTF